MPKSYSDQERAYIRKRLKEEAAACMGQYGIRRTTVDEIVRRVNIPKGTFYLFYSSKELLLFDVILEEHERIDQELFEAVRSIAGPAFSPEALTEVLLRFFRMAEELPVLRLLNSGEVELLARKLPKEVVAEHFGNDTDMVERILSLLPVRPGLDAKVISAAFHAIYFSTLHKEEIGEALYEDALRTLIDGVVRQMVSCEA
ncbi:MAG: TetR/AcrR family transcriptional regulator [Candidatus Ventricola sp.]